MKNIRLKSYFITLFTILTILYTIFTIYYIYYILYILIDIVRIDCAFGWKSVQTLERDNMLWAVNLSLSIKITTLQLDKDKMTAQHQLSLSKVCTYSHTEKVENTLFILIMSMICIA